ncbi:MAG: C10 family peptidase, partial [Muribaculaceae bacterium]|nr:C10 family peptidase [Muribaculaceae bacterium]
MLLTVSFLLSAQGLFAKPLDEKDARRVAASFFAAGNYGRIADESAFVLAQTARDNSGGRAYYVFNASDGNGFIVVNATDDSEPVIAYSYDGTFGNGSMPDAATSVLGNVRKYITATGHSPLRKRGVASNAVSGRKLLNTAPWSQEAPFNNLIPNRRLTGCVGIAMSIIMRHHSYPAKGTGSVGSTSLESEYDWTHMRADNYRSGYNAVEAKAVATLVSHAAQSILTDFGMSSSSAFEVRVPSALINHFGYDAGVSYKKRAEMDREAWDNLIVSEIEAGRPVLYSGQDVSAGHAFVCDGY